MEPLGAPGSNPWCPTLDFPPWSYMAEVLRKGQNTSWWLPYGFWSTLSQLLAPFLLRCSILGVPSLVHHPEVSRKGQDTS